VKEFVAIFSLVILITASKCTGSGGKDKFAGMSSDSTLAEIVFREYEHDFGKVAEGGKISWQFVYENKGSGSLVLNAVSTTCGCTVPKFSKKPVPPGGKGSIEVVFDASGRSGKQTKIISVMSNSIKPVTLLRITAEVTQDNQ
jgi:hypothetical protein